MSSVSIAPYFFLTAYVFSFSVFLLHVFTFPGLFSVLLTILLPLPLQVLCFCSRPTPVTTLCCTTPPCSVQTSPVTNPLSPSPAWVTFSHSLSPCFLASSPIPSLHRRSLSLANVRLHSLEWLKLKPAENWPVQHRAAGKRASEYPVTPPCVEVQLPWGGLT